MIGYFAQGLEIDYRDNINPASEEILTHAVLESSLGTALAEQTFQFERLGYFTADQHAHQSAKPVFNRVVNLRDTWAK
jgi:glutaminyl-tRNA synthetase